VPQPWGKNDALCTPEHFLAASGSFSVAATGWADPPAALNSEAIGRTSKLDALKHRSENPFRRDYQALIDVNSRRQNSRHPSGSWAQAVCKILPPRPPHGRSATWTLKTEELVRGGRHVTCYALLLCALPPPPSRVSAENSRPLVSLSPHASCSRPPHPRPPQCRECTPGGFPVTPSSMLAGAAPPPPPAV